MALHATVLKQEAVAALSVKTNGFYVDATFGRGGHSAALLRDLGDKGQLLVLDRDPQAVAAAEKMSEAERRMQVEYAAFSQIKQLAGKYGVEGKVDGILFDLGVSSPQLDDANRGFSFMRDGPLDMRMNSNTGITAAQWINSAAEADIANVLYKYGDEKYSRRMARAIVKHRAEEKIERTAVLAEIVKAAHPSWSRDKHPATKAFQAIRIHINGEFDELEQGLDQAEAVLAPGGRMVVISFHSLEDRMVKQFINKHAKGDDFPRGLPITAEQLSPRLKKIGKAVKPGARELAENPRARSAVMRVAEKLPRGEQ